MNNYFYPAIFHSDKESGGYWISFPDFPECMTQGDSLEEAYKMAVEALGLCIDDRIREHESLPDASAPLDYLVEEGDFSCLIEFDLLQYQRNKSNKSVKKTLTLPQWLNEACVAQNINFSQVLQEALLQKIGML